MEREFVQYLKLMSRLSRLPRRRGRVISDELLDHMHARFTELCEAGVASAQAIRLVLEEFGDAAELAGQIAAWTREVRTRQRTHHAAMALAGIAATLVLGLLWPGGRTWLIDRLHTAPSAPAVWEQRGDTSIRLDTTAACQIDRGVRANALTRGMHTAQKTSINSLPAWLAVDRDYHTGAQGNWGGEPPWWWQIDLGETRAVTNVNWINAGGWDPRLDDFIWEAYRICGSADGVSWTALLDVSGNTGKHPSHDFAPPIRFRYWRLEVSKIIRQEIWPGDTYCNILELEINGQDQTAEITARRGVTIRTTRR